MISKQQEKTRFYRIVFSLLALLILQWNLACNSKREVPASSTVSGDEFLPPIDTFDTGGGGGTVSDEDLFIPTTGDDPLPEVTGAELEENVNICAPASSTIDGGMPLQPATGSGDLNFIRGARGNLNQGEFAFDVADPQYQEQFGSTFNCMDTESDDQSVQMLLSEALNGMKHMANCFRQVAFRIPPANSKQSTIDLAFMVAQLAMVRCYRNHHNRLVVSLPLIVQAQQQQRSRDSHYFALIQSITNGFGR